MDTPCIVEKIFITGRFCGDFPIEPFCVKLFAASFKTNPTFKRRSMAEKISKYHENLKKSIFFNFHFLTRNNDKL